MQTGRRFNGQGALEYLLLIAGAVLVGAVVLVLITGNLLPSGSGILRQNLCAYSTFILGESCTPSLNTLRVQVDSPPGNGQASFRFTWNESRYPPNVGNAAAGIVGGSDLLSFPQTLVSLSNLGAWAVMTPVFSPENGAGQSGTLSSESLKAFARAQLSGGGSPLLQFSFVGDTDGVAIHPFALPASIAYPPDTEAPEPIAQFAASTGSSPGSILLSFTEPHDSYLGAPIAGPFLFYIAVYSTSPLVDFDAQVGSGQFVSVAAESPGSAFALEIDNLAPGTTYYLALRACDSVDERTVNASNCTAPTPLASAVSGG